MEYTIIPCIICHKKLENINSDISEAHNTPYGGTLFETHGHYGSTYFDPMDKPEFLEIIICDDCLRKNEKYIFKFERIN